MSLAIEEVRGYAFAEPLPMKYVDEFRDAGIISGVAREIARTVNPSRLYRIMEVCGGHTHSIYRHGLRDVLPENIELVHGPGCPVCVLPTGRVDDGLAIAARENVILTCFGDMMRVPGTKGTPLELKARGADIRMVYSPLDALRIAASNPEKHVCFFAIGFETTAPSTALTILRAQELGVTNFSVFCNHVTIVPAMRAILDSPDMRIDGFVGPGHVSSITGCRPYEFIARDYGKPVVVSGFEPLDILESILMILRQLGRRRGTRRESIQANRSMGRQSAGADGTGAGLRVAPVFRVARPRLHFAIGPEHQAGLRGLRRREAFQRSRRPRDRSARRAVRRGPQGRAESAAMQTLRNRV